MFNNFYSIFEIMTIDYKHIKKILLFLTKSWDRYGFYTEKKFLFQKKIVPFFLIYRLTHCKKNYE
jgi:hypothetical protein